MPIIYYIHIKSVIDVKWIGATVKPECRRKLSHGREQSFLNIKV